MTPQTRSAAKPSPGRTTRNSVYGRPSPSPSKPRKSSTDDFPARNIHAHETEGGIETANASDITPWLACRDPYGILTSVTMSETGEGVHIRWYYPEDDCEVDEDQDADVEMIADEGRGVTPPTAGSNNAVRRIFPQTPMALYSFDAGSVIRTPVKKAKPLQPSPPRIGDKGVRCLYEKGGVLRELNGQVRVVLRHPIGSSANLSRAQVECLEDKREEGIIQVQVERLLAQKQRIEEEERFSDSGYEDGMETNVSSLQRGIQREGTNETILVSHNELYDIVSPALQQEPESALGFCRGPNGELLGHHGHQMLGREGTILIDPAYGSPRRIRREEAFLVSTESVGNSSPNEQVAQANGLRRPCFGPHGTELID